MGEVYARQITTLEDLNNFVKRSAVGITKLLGRGSDGTWEFVATLATWPTDARTCRPTPRASTLHAVLRRVDLKRSNRDPAHDCVWGPLHEEDRRPGRIHYLICLASTV